jgi:hyperosmotically inducible periplasmic protein
MKALLRFTMVALVALLTFNVAFAADSDTDRAHPQTFVKDSVITTKVKASLAADHASNLAKVHVDTDQNGVVWLSGTVESSAIASRAVAIAEKTEGVRAVRNDIKVSAED